MEEFFDLKLWDNTVLDYLIFLGSLAVSIIVILFVRRLLLRRLTAWAENTSASLDDLAARSFRKYVVPLLLIGAVYLNTKWLKLGAGVSGAVDITSFALAMIFGASIVSSVFIYFFNKALERKQKKVDKLAVRWIGAIIKAIIWVCALLLFLENIGVHISALVAGLGIGGIAVAFAAQAVLEDVFSFITIFFDRPFEIDDFVVVDDLMGTVEHVGIKTTRLRSINGEQLIFSNKDLTNSRLKNYKRMENRRVVFSFSVTYSTPTDKLRMIPEKVKNIIDGIDNARFDRAHLKELGDSSLVFEAAYYVLSQDYNLYMDIQQSIILALKDELEMLGAEFAFPARTVYLQNKS